MTWQKATALVPLALLSGAWTASLAGTSTASADTGDGAKLPDGTSIPAEAVKAPASVSAPGVIAPGVPAGAADSVIASASTNGIPSAALAAYQRAAQVINAADPGCHIDWTLIAAIGRVESDHGRYGGNTLSAKGVSTPGIYGIPLDGSNGTAKISDTDAGEIDDDPVVDRAVGPMQFIPSTWSVVGVDGDGDGVRNPQDIDDAALATAVYLCSGDEDLSTAAGQQAAVYRYNHSQKYVDLVLSIMRAYSTGDYSAVPNGSAAPATFAPYFGDSVVSSATRGFKPFKSKAGGKKAGAPAKSGGSGSAPASGGGSGSASGGDTTGPVTTDPGTPTGDATGDVKKKVDDTVKKVTEPVQPVLISTSQAIDLCTSALNSKYGAAPQEAVDQCASQLQGKTLEEAKSAVGGIVAGLGDLVSGLLGDGGGLLGGGDGSGGGLLG
ncbi:MAG: lytic murein transglycosylase [Nocardioides sp.]